MDERILVTGAGGFIGSHLARKFLKQNLFVRVVDIKWDGYIEDPYYSEKLTLDLRDKENCININEYVLNQGDELSFNLIRKPNENLKVTICWNDPEGTPVAPSIDPSDRMLVNDLDLRIVGNGKTYEPWVLNKNSPSLPATTGDNIVDNVEFGADVIYLLYFGKTDWNILDFLPERVTSIIPSDIYPLYQFSYQDSIYLDNVYARFANYRLAFTIGK